MAAQDALSGPQFGKHKHPLGGPGGVEDRLRGRAEWERSQAGVDAGYLHQLTTPHNHGAAMAMINDKDGRAGYYLEDGPGSRAHYWRK